MEDDVILSPRGQEHTGPESSQHSWIQEEILQWVGILAWPGVLILGREERTLVFI